MKTRFFLGANSPDGFKSLYGDFVDPVNDRLNIIKSGPGSGKSTFMKIIAEKAESNGLDVELIQCSGDPDSLDGVYLPQKNVAYVDGTSPHVIDAVYAGSGDNYIDLSRFYDRAGIRSAHSEIVELTQAYKEEYSKAYLLISAYSSAKRALMPDNSEYIAKGVKRIKGIISRELKRSENDVGKVKRRFLDGITCKGNVTLYDTVQQLCDRVYQIDGLCGISDFALQEIYLRGKSLNLNMILCLSPNDEGINHILFPQLSTAFITENYEIPYPYPVYRRIRLDSIPDAGFIKAIKEAKRVSDALSAKAIEKLQRAKALHDELEKKYNPFVDFDAVRSLANTEAEMLLR